MIALVNRNLKVYFRDKASVFFSLLAVIIIFLVYLLFLGDVWAQNLPQVEGVRPMEQFWVIASIVVSIAAIAVAWYFYGWVKKLPSANDKLDQIGKLIRDGAFTFIKREYKTLLYFCGGASLLILLLFPKPIWTGAGVGMNIAMVGAYLFGSVLSGTAGVVGISIATIANVKAASAAQKGIAPSFMAGFRGGAVMGMWRPRIWAR